MTDSPSDSDLGVEESRLLQWFERYCEAQATGGTCEIPDEIRQQFPRLEQMQHCLGMLDSLAVPPFGEAIQQHNEQGTSHEEAHSSWSRLPRDFGPYVLEEELGRGGMGVVYRARHRTLQTDFAVKMIRTSDFASVEEVRRFFREAQMASRLRHPQIVSVHDAGELDGMPFLVMQYVQGVSLAERLKNGRIAVDEAVLLLVTVSRAVHFLHEHQTIHRDLKPGNILLDGRDVPYVTDFGLAKLFTLDAERTTTGTIIGTPAYMAPEQAWGKGNRITAACDIYSLGAIFYEMLTGQPPFPESNPLDQMLRLRDADPRPPREIVGTTPLELEQICLRCLEKRPEHRYLSAAELADDLDRYAHSEPITIRPITWWQSLTRWVRREPALVSHLIGFATIATIVQGADWMAGRHRAAYGPVMIVLAVWTVLATILQKLLLQDYQWSKVAWVAVDGILFTVALSYAEGPMESLIVGYSLLIVASGLWYDVRLVWLMTVVSVISYFTLLWNEATIPVPWHYPLIVVGMLLVVGGMVAGLVRRIRHLLSLQTNE